MRKFWSILASTELTIVLAILVCINAGVGSILTVKNPEFYGRLDAGILLPTLIKTEGGILTGWIYLLIVLVSIFTLNTIVCTTDKTIGIIRQKYPWQAFLPHLVHVGFLIAMLGHLVGATFGFKSPPTYISQGRLQPVPENPGLYIRLDSIEKEGNGYRDLKSLKTTVTLFDGAEKILTDTIEINGPLIYKGVAFYHLKDGKSPAGLMLDIDGKELRANFNKSFYIGEKRFLMGRLFPDFAKDDKGTAYSMSRNYRNPHQEIISPTGERTYLGLRNPGAFIKLSGSRIEMKDFLYDTYAIIKVSKDPGIWLIIIGSSILTLGIILIFIFRRRELVKHTA